jgi:hypothetical protein
MGGGENGWEMEIGVGGFVKGCSGCQCWGCGTRKMKKVFKFLLAFLNKIWKNFKNSQNFAIV